jgi:gliding motility-associated-like protein
MIRRGIFSLFVFICSFQALRAANNVTITVSDTVCQGSEVTIKGSVATGTVTSWHWSYQYIGAAYYLDSLHQNPTHIFADTGYYVITLIVHYSPAGTDTQNVILYVEQTATASFATSSLTKGVPQAVTFTNTSTHAPNGYIWNFGDNSTLVQNTLSNPSHTYSAIGTYTVSLIAFGVKGCNDTTSSPLIIADTILLTMPNIFTPNNDGINEYFAPNAHGMKSLSCTIYDRWGIKILTLDNDNVSYWDGHTTSGIACSEGTYFYTLTATDLNNKSYNLKGFFQLIR